MNNPNLVCNLRDLHLLPNNWSSSVRETVQRHSFSVYMNGKHSTSREPHNTFGTKLNIVNGEIIKQELPWLFQLYCTELLELIKIETGVEYEISSDICSGININYLKGFGARYEWHVDSNHLTGLIFASTHLQGDGGELVFSMKEKELTIYPNEADFLIFDARKIPHTVLPLIKSHDRISIPMNFYKKGAPQEYPLDLNAYLFGSNTEKESR